jgi:hypothetical protein
LPPNVVRVDYGEGSAENVARGYDSYLAVSMEVPWGLPREGKAVPANTGGRRGPRPGTSQTRERRALTFSGELPGQLVRQLTDWPVS